MQLPARVVAACLLLLPVACARTPSLEGTWRGDVVLRGARLECAVHIRTDRDSLRATFSSPELLLLGQPLDSLRVDPPRLSFMTSDEHPVRFDGVLAGDSITGTARLERVPGMLDSAGTASFTLRRTIVPPPPYATERVTFRSGTETLGGTIYLPPGMPHTLPGVVLLQGSSANLRHEYRFYADRFARAGFAVMAFDKRGHGESTGDYGSATYDDLVHDAAAAVARLRADPRVVPSRVGLWGLSQGAFLAPMVAARADSLAFIVALSPPGMPIGLTAAYQDSMRLVAGGLGADAHAAAVLDRRIHDWLGLGSGRKELTAELDGVADTPWRRASSIPRHLPHGAALESWYWRGRTLDPLPAWRALRVPALVVLGASDELIPAGPSAAAISRALEQGGNPDHVVQTIPGASHTLIRRPPRPPAAWDWPRVAPGVLERVDEWMSKHALPKP